MTYRLLRTSEHDDETGKTTSHGGKFLWPEVGEIVKPIRWDERPICGNGIHGLLNAHGNWALMSRSSGRTYQVIECDEYVEVTEDGGGKVKTNKAKLIYQGDLAGAMKFFPKFKHPEDLTPQEALARGFHDVGARDKMAKIIIESGSAGWANAWARNIESHQNQIVQVVIDSKDAYEAYVWARDVGTYKDDMAEIVTRFGSAYCVCCWAVNVKTHISEMAKIIAANEYYTNYWNAMTGLPKITYKADPNA